VRQTQASAYESGRPQQNKKDGKGTGVAQQHALTLAAPPIKKALGLPVLSETASWCAALYILFKQSLEFSSASSLTRLTPSVASQLLWLKCEQCNLRGSSQV
jgi:hypothetical protein